MDNNTQEEQKYMMVRITLEAHAALRELAEAQMRSMSNTVEWLISKEYASMQATNTPTPTE